MGYVVVAAVEGGWVVVAVAGTGAGSVAVAEAAAEAAAELHAYPFGYLTRFYVRLPRRSSGYRVQQPAAVRYSENLTCLNSHAH